MGVETYVVGNPWKNWSFVRDGYVSPPDGPGFGLELDLEEVSKHPYRRGNWLPLFKQDWERREGGE